MPPSGRRVGDIPGFIGIVTASTPGKAQSCRPRTPSPFPDPDTGTRRRWVNRSARLQCPRPGAEAGIELHRSRAGVADRAPDLLEIARSEVVALLQVDALFGGLAHGIGRDRSEFVGEPADELGELALAPPHLGQLADQHGARLVRLLEQPTEDERETVRTISGRGLGKTLDLGQSSLRRDAPRRDLTDESGDPGIGPPISLGV